MLTIRCLDRQFANIQAVIFDKDGTLENSSDYLYQLAQKRTRLVDAQIPGVGEPLLLAFGVQNNKLDPAGLMCVGSRNENAVAAAAYIAETGRGWIEAKNIVDRAFTEADTMVPNDLPGQMLPGSLELIDRLFQAGLPLGILSNAPSSDVQNFVRHHELHSYLSLQMGADGAITKPHPSLFLDACAQMGVEPARTLMIGDSAGDIEMAQRAGAAGCIAVTWGIAAPHLANADAIVDDLQAIQLLLA
jgi:phosphoglycolate phosphatase